MYFTKKDIGVDLGTANTLIYIKEKGIVLNEPSVIAVDTYLKKVIAVGAEAKEMLGKAPEHIRVVRPLEEGVISDFAMTAEMLKAFMGTVMERSGALSRVRVVVGVPSGVTEVERRAVEEVVRQMGAKEVYILDEPMAAAIGCDLDVDSSTGCMIADIGGGTSDIAVIALGGIVASTSLRHAGDKLNDAIVNYMKRKYSLWVGEQTAEEIKKKVGCAFVESSDAKETYDASGRDIISGLPKTVKVSSEEMFEALEEPVGMIVDGIKNTLENTPPEISSDIVKSGIVLSGGGALIKGIGKLITNETGLKVTIAENAMEAVAEGTGKSLSDVESLVRYSSKKIRK